MANSLWLRSKLRVNLIVSQALGGCTRPVPNARPRKGYIDNFRARLFFGSRLVANRAANTTIALHLDVAVVIRRIRESAGTVPFADSWR